MISTLIHYIAQYIIPFQKQDQAWDSQNRNSFLAFVPQKIESRASISTSYEPPDVVKEVKRSIWVWINALESIFGLQMLKNQFRFSLQIRF